MALKELNFAVPNAVQRKSKTKVADGFIVPQSVDSESTENTFEYNSDDAWSLSEASSGDDSEDEELLAEEMLERVTKNYWHARKEYDAMVDADGQALFEEALAMHVKYQVRGGGKPKPLSLPKLKVDPSKDACGTLTNVLGRVVDRAPLFTLPAVQTLPPMQYWTLTEVNINAEEETSLSHIPYIDAITDKQEAELWNDLKTAYPDGIHGTEKGLGEFINDWLCYKTVKNVLVESTLDARDSKELRWVMRHVRELFPNKGSVDSLVATYPDLKQRFEPEQSGKVVMMNDRAELVANFAPDKLMASCKTLMCQVCLTYVCQRHTSQALTANAAPLAHEEQDGSKEEVAQEPCGYNCYLVKGPHAAARKTKVARLTLPRKKGSHKAMPSGFDQQSTQWSASDLNPPSNVPGWSAHEKSLYWLAQSSAGGKYCALAKLIAMLTPSNTRSKNCREVYDFVQRTSSLKPKCEVKPPAKKRYVAKKKTKRQQHNRFRTAKWTNHSGRVANTARYIACEHVGPCSLKNGCRCVEVGNNCTKSCRCLPECAHRFPGCGCKASECRTKGCPCVFAQLECDPDVCKSCNCDMSDDDAVPKCRNANVQRGLQKKLIVGRSLIAGWGCFADEDIEKGAFISEYTGEVVSHAEGERRGRIYDHKKCSYLFALNNEQQVDATRIGNAVRFINHDMNANCKARVLVVNGEHKIAIFAARPIKRGEELFFDYRYEDAKKVQYGIRDTQTPARTKKGSRAPGSTK